MPRIIIIRDRDVNEWAVANRDKLEPLGCLPCGCEAEDDDRPEERGGLTGFFDAATVDLQAHLDEELGLRLLPDLDDTGSAVAIDLDAIPLIEKLAHDIMAEYDSDGPKPNWDHFGLSGDDDVDYNGSYLLIGLNLVKYYLGLQNLDDDTRKMREAEDQKAADAGPYGRIV